MSHQIWECPRCGRINAPHNPACFCSKNTNEHENNYIAGLLFAIGLIDEECNGHLEGIKRWELSFLKGNITQRICTKRTGHLTDEIYKYNKFRKKITDEAKKHSALIEEKDYMSIVYGEEE